MTFNTASVAQQDPVISDMREIVNMLSSVSSEVKSMVTFNAELVRQKSIQRVAQGSGRSFVSWGSRTVMLRPVSEHELNDDKGNIKGLISIVKIVS